MPHMRIDRLALGVCREIAEASTRAIWKEMVVSHSLKHLALAAERLCAAYDCQSEPLLTLAETRRLCRIEGIPYRAVLEILVEANMLCRRSDGSYLRTPQPARQSHVRDEVTSVLG